MTDKQRMAFEKLERFYDSLAADLDKLTDEELLTEVKEDGEDIDLIASHMADLISETIEETGRKKMAAARVGLDAQRTQSAAKVLQMPLADKRVLIGKFTKNDNGLTEKMTLAARSGEDTEADVDSFLEDLIELGVIDDEGNIT